MAVEIVTKEDLQTLRFQIMGDMRELLASLGRSSAEDLRGYKSAQVRQLLICSSGKLKSLRATGQIRTKKIGGTIYYSKDDVHRLLTGGL
jgi:hypothetical protein